MSRGRKLIYDHNAEWLRAERARRRLAFLKSRHQRRDEIARLARAGLRVVRLPSLVDAIGEMDPRCL